MKIAHLTTVDMSLRYLLLPQLEAASELGETIGISARGEFVAELESRGIRHVGLASSTRGMNPIADLSSMRELWSILKQERPDILHTHNPKPGVYGRILGRLTGVPLVVNTVHGLYATAESPIAKRLLVYAVEFIASRFSDAELVQNPEDLELLARLRITAPSKLRLLGNGVDLDRFSPERASAARERARAGLDLDSDEFAVGMVGRLVAEKGIPELIEAARLLSGRVRLFVVGPHDLEKTDAVSQETLAMGERAGVEFLGMRKDVDALYGGFDAFVLPSHREGFPRAAMEAAASGLPLVLTDIRGCRQVVEHGVNGFLVPVGNPIELARAIEELLDDPELRRRMGVASARRARAEFDENRVVEIVIQTYRDLAERKGLSWDLDAVFEPVVLRAASPGDTAAIARLHTRMIDTGFLASLGAGFLRVLYSALIESENGLLIVADGGGTVVGFISGTADTREFYREFLRRRLLSAVWHLLPALIRPETWKRFWETLRYGTTGEAASAELLSIAVAPRVQGTGLGSRLVEALLAWAESEEIDRVKVVVGADNNAAISLYSKYGFKDPTELELHTGVASVEMIWRP